MEEALQILQAYGAAVRADPSSICAGLAVGLGAGIAWRRYGARLDAPTRQRIAAGLPLATLACALAVGLAGVFREASVLDDAYISMRYAENWVEGLGLVFNAGERVEGYTNFLWTILLGVGIAITPFEAPLIAVGMSIAAFAGNLIVVYALGASLARSRGGPHLPVALALVAVQGVFVQFGSTGLETGAASLCVSLGVLALIGRRTLRHAGLGSAALVTAAFLRPDHALFYAAGGLLVGWEVLSPIVRDRRWGGLRELSPILAYAAPAASYALYLVWRVAYYGELLPNTWYAKSGGLWNPGQGAIYTETFYLGAHFWVIAVLVLWWAFERAGSLESRRFKALLLMSLAAWHVYVLKIGGDFMYGRFFVPLIPLLLLAVEDWLARRCRDGPSWATIGIGSAVLATAGGVAIIAPGQIRWNISDEGTFYRIARWFPKIEIESEYYGAAQQLRRLVYDRGLRPKVATVAIGQVGYYSRLELVDMVGLTDKELARAPLRTRGRPGHEKRASDAYLRRRAPVIARSRLAPPPHLRNAVALEALGEEWYLVRYDAQLVARVPELGVADIDTLLADYIGRMRHYDARGIRQDLRWLDAYYFDRHPADERRAMILARLREAAARSARR